MAALIELDNVIFRYPETGQPHPPALRGVSLRIEEGEYVALVGSNGSGKTTLARHLNGLLLPTSGHVRVGGLDTNLPSNLPPIRTQVGMVFQAPEDQVIATVVEEDVAFGLENLGVPADEILPRVEAALRSVGMWEQRRRPSYMLSAGQMQRVALAGVLAMRPRAIVFDEATALLDPVGRKDVLERIDQLNAEGLTIVAITHSMEEAARAKRVIVLEQGKVALDGPAEAIFNNSSTLNSLGLDLPPAAFLAAGLHQVLPAVSPNLLRPEALLEHLPTYSGSPSEYGQTSAGSSLKTSTGQALIEVDQLGHIYMAGTPLAQRALENANLSVAQAEAHGVLGATGSGKSTLLQHLNGLLRPQEGSVRVGSFDLGDLKVDLKAVRQIAGLAFQLPEMQIFEQYVGDEIAYGPRMLGHTGTLREAVKAGMEMVGLDFDDYKDRLTSSLSGGECRKVALASILALRPPILLLDEPTAGLDPVSRQELILRLTALRSGGTTLVVSTHDMEEAAGLTENLSVMSGGRDVLHGPASSVFEQVAELRALGLESPITVQAANVLRSRGWPLPQGLIQPEQLIQAVANLVRMAAG